MSPSNGPSGEMDENPWFPRDPLQLDDGTVDRLLDGLPVDDAPPSYRGVAELLRTIKAAPVTSPEIAPRPSRYASPPRVSVPYSTPSPSKPRSHRRFRRASAALVGSATLFVGLGAVGALPGAAQVVASNVLGTVGVNAPNPDAPVNVDSKPAVNTDGPSGATIVDPGTDGPSAPGTGTTISGIASDGSTTGVDKGAAVSGIASDGQSDAGQPDAPASPKTGSPDPADNGNSDGNNGNHNGADNGNGSKNGNANGANNGNVGVGQANKP